ncbi:MAG: hypothetical protein BWY09_00941 [Candidatus Hydrogenedentes bacterium ADurb.Bin179]|nr:MAG: hypothetical protein BWY09_00941 [Candidatus Hydrogenedentes bacterium ADurb.Bin179]
MGPLAVNTVFTEGNRAYEDIRAYAVSRKRPYHIPTVTHWTSLVKKGLQTSDDAVHMCTCKVHKASRHFQGWIGILLSVL